MTLPTPTPVTSSVAPPAAPTNGSGAERLAQIDAWLEHLATETDHAAHGAEITRYLRVLARFHRYSAHNCMLIVMQRPDATHVAGYRAWQALGRQIKKGAKGIAILCPVPIHDKEKAKDDPDAVIALRFRVGYVFDTLSRDSNGARRG